MTRWKVAPGGALRGRVQVPGDKSIAHRCLMFAALAQGTSRVDGLPAGEDVRSTAAVLQQLGVPIALDAGAARVDGLESWTVPAGPLDCGNSGTTLRLMAGLLAGRRVPATLTGDASLRRRPMDRIARPLREMGARIDTQHDGCAPLRLHGDPVAALHYRSPVASAQVKSCVLLAGLGATGRTCVTEPFPTRDHTERLLSAMGVGVDRTEAGVCLQGPARPQPLAGTVPGDVSSAAFWVASACVTPGSDLLLPAVGVNPTRRAVLDLLRDWGARIELADLPADLGEPRADLRVRAVPELSGGRIDAAVAASMIDELPLLGLLAPFTREGVRVTGASELRVKESDRIASTCAALRALGIEVDEAPDGFTVRGGQTVRGGTVNSAGDHRIALATAAIAPAASGEVVIENAGAAAVSYPGFDAELERVRR